MNSNHLFLRSLIPIHSWDRHWQTTRDLELATRAAEYNKRNYPLEMTLMPLPTPSFKFESGPAAGSARSLTLVEFIVLIRVADIHGTSYLVGGLEHVFFSIYWE
jgi:hypothetical protein